MKLLATLMLFALSAAAQWQPATPESQGMSSKKLDALRDGLAARTTKTFLVIRHDRLVYEWYAPDWNKDKPHGTASLAKQLVGSTSLILALGDRKLSLDDTVCKYVPQWKDDPLKKIVTIKQLATHTSGLEDSVVAPGSGKPHQEQTGWQGEFWKQLDPPKDPFTLSRDMARVVRPPGTTFPPGDDTGYSNPGYAMLSYAVAAAYRGTPYTDLRVLLRDRLMRPIGAADEEWSIGYKKTYQVDGLPLVATWGGGNYTARAVARVGCLMLHDGKWDGKQVLSAEWVRHAKKTGDCGWWLHGIPKRLPQDAFLGAGAGMEVLIVVPSLDLVVVRNGRDLSDESDWGGLATWLVNPLMDSIVKP